MRHDRYPTSGAISIKRYFRAIYILLRPFVFLRTLLYEQVGRKFGRWLDVVDYELLLNPGDGEF